MSLHLINVIEKQIEINKILGVWWAINFLKRALVIYPIIKSKGAKDQTQWARHRLMPFRFFIIVAGIKRKIKKVVFN